MKKRQKTDMAQSMPKIEICQKFNDFLNLLWQSFFSKKREGSMKLTVLVLLFITPILAESQIPFLTFSDATLIAAKRVIIETDGHEAIPY